MEIVKISEASIFWLCCLFILSSQISYREHRQCKMWAHICKRYEDARLGLGLEDTVVNKIDMVPILKLTEESVKTEIWKRHWTSLVFAGKFLQDNFWGPSSAAVHHRWLWICHEKQFLISCSPCHWEQVLEKLCCMHFPGIVSVINLLATCPFEIILCT